MKISVLGAGTWGMALARLLSKQGHDITVWSALEDEVIRYSKERKHPNLPGMVIPAEIQFTTSVRKACEYKDIIIFAVPSIFVRETVRKTAPFLCQDQILVNVAKGIETGSLYTMSQVINDELGNKFHDIVSLSGPTHAEEVAQDLPTTIISASDNLILAQKVQDVFMTTCMRVYTNDDILGVELCGALKNIIALATGISGGLGYGDNASAALITRGMAEITRLGIAMGCKKGTFYGLAGIGDLIVTATSQHSRNNRAGRLIGSGADPAEAVKQVGMVVEGIYALPAAISLSERYEIEMPIVRAVDEIINHHADVFLITRQLMLREKKQEF